MNALRPYQTELVARVTAAIRRSRTVCLQLGTGGGKTHTAAHVLERAASKGFRSLFLAHLDTLIEDTHERLTRSGLHAGYVQAGRPSDASALTQVASLQTLIVRGTRPPADFLIIDECHRSMAPSVRTLLEAYPRASILGLSAVPQRADGAPLGDVYTELVVGPSMLELTKQGHLAPCDLIAPPVYQDRGLICDPVDAYKRWTPEGRAIVFAQNVHHAEEIHARFGEQGIVSALLTGETTREERRRLRDGLARGSISVLVGVSVFLEGWDCPAVDTVILARAFSVCGGFLQAIGRGLRSHPDKTKCTVLDLRGAVNLHGLPDEPRVWSLTGKACRRADVLTPLSRCKECLAIFRTAARCPRCGAEIKADAKLPRVLNRAEKASSMTGLPQSERDRRYLFQLQRVAIMRIQLDARQSLKWAMRKFVERFGRQPECKL